MHEIRLIQMCLKQDLQ